MNTLSADNNFDKTIQGGSIDINLPLFDVLFGSNSSCLQLLIQDLRKIADNANKKIDLI